MNGKLPTFDQLINPVLRALQTLGGSGSIEEIYERIIEAERISDDLLAIPHDIERSTQTEVAYRLGWARTYLKKSGYLDNSSRGVWALTAKWNRAGEIDIPGLLKKVRGSNRQISNDQNDSPASQSQIPHGDEWKEKLYVLLTQRLKPDGFERLVQRLLRESGFTQVEVTGRSGDGGIDGRGIVRIQGGLLSFHVLFQCKRYRGAVGAGAIRDFRGAMIGRSDKGLFITTGTFTPAAKREATRDGAPAIDLVDGDDLAEKMKKLALGIETSLTETIAIDEVWFESI